MNLKSIHQLALTLPGPGGGYNITPPSGLDTTRLSNLSGLISGFLEVAFYLAAFLAFFWFVWGAFAYLMAEGDKETLAKARLRIQWALIGLLVIFMAFFITGFIAQIFGPDKFGLPFAIPVQSPNP